jgi:hypothetical protein
MNTGATPHQSSILNHSLMRSGDNFSDLLY